MFAAVQRHIGLPPLGSPLATRPRQTTQNATKGPLRGRHSRDCHRNGVCEYCWNLENQNNSCIDETSAALTDNPFTDDSDSSLSSCLDEELSPKKEDVKRSASAEVVVRRRNAEASPLAPLPPKPPVDRRLSAPVDSTPVEVVTRRTVIRRRINTNSLLPPPYKGMYYRESTSLASRSHLSGSIAS